jgi:hypothetical protein
MVKRAENQNQSARNRREGEITVDFKPTNAKKFNNGDGKYVDYEEVKD